MPATLDSLARRANELYWNSDHTVDEIMTELGMSRSALYAAVQPHPAGERCPTCGGEMVYANRTGRDAHRAVCNADHEEAAEAERAHPTARHAAAHAGSEEGAGGEGPAPARRWTRFRDDLSGVEAERFALVGGAAALGMMVGAVATRAVRERL